MLPVVLDVGTNNEALLADPSYLGTRMNRLSGDEYFDMVDEFMHAVFSRVSQSVSQSVSGHANFLIVGAYTSTSS